MEEIRIYEQRIKKGLYRHFKGNYYELVGFAYHSEDMSCMVVYRALYGDREMWVRPVSMWEEYVERDGERYRRFEFVSSEIPEHLKEKG